MSVGWLRPTTQTPTHAIIMAIQFFIDALFINPILSGTQLARKTRASYIQFVSETNVADICILEEL